MAGFGHALTCRKRSSKIRTFKSLESLRGWMAWIVVIGHALQLLRPKGEAWHFVSEFINPMQAVMVFIILSGFVITHLLLGKQEPYSAYIRRRFFRIAPVYFLAVLLALAVIQLDFAAYSPHWVGLLKDRTSRMHALFGNPLPHLFAHLSLIHGAIPDKILPSSSRSILGPAWSLSLEWQFYLIAPLLVALLRGPAIRTVLVVAAGFMVSVTLSRLHAWAYPSFVLLALPHFFTGMLSRLLIEQRSNGKWPIETTACLVFCLAWIKPYPAVIWIVFFAATLIEAGILDQRSRVSTYFFKAIAFNRIISALGRWSYSTYLLHIPLFGLVLGSYVMFAGGPDSAHRSAYWALMGVTLPLVIGVSYLSYRFIEQPFTKLGSRHKVEPLAPATSAVEAQST